MSSEKIDYANQTGCYLTFATVDCVDIFIRPVHKQIIVHSLNHFIEHKGLSVFSWCLMTNTLHLLTQVRDSFVLNELEKEFKCFTTKKILEAIDTESSVRRGWLLDRLKKPKHSWNRTVDYQVWQESKSPGLVDLNDTNTLVDIFETIHSLPVRDRIVDTDCEFLYSSARDYAGMQGLVEITKLPIIDQLVTVDMTSSFFGKFVRY
ncbi:MAG: hypothetical protein H7Y42_06305 [Chitinophagaceae bacterium]|nr:hypothetical protein [Chitinophagaceae bacterium]